MYQKLYRGSAAIILIMVVVVVILLFAIFNSGHSSSPSTNTATTSPIGGQASSTVSQALQLTKWLAKEYAPQKK